MSERNYIPKKILEGMLAASLIAGCAPTSEEINATALPETITLPSTPEPVQTEIIEAPSLFQQEAFGEKTAFEDVYMADKNKDPYARAMSVVMYRVNTEKKIVSSCKGSLISLPDGSIGFATVEHCVKLGDNGLLPSVTDKGFTGALFIPGLGHMQMTDVGNFKKLKETFAPEIEDTMAIYPIPQDFIPEIQSAVQENTINIPQLAAKDPNLPLHAVINHNGGIFTAVPFSDSLTAIYERNNYTVVLTSPEERAKGNVLGQRDSGTIFYQIQNDVPVVIGTYSGDFFPSFDSADSPVYEKIYDPLTQYGIQNRLNRSGKQIYTLTPDHINNFQLEPFN